MDKESAKSHFQFTTGWPRDADACAYLEVIKSLTSLLRHGERSPTHAHSLSQTHTRRDGLADGLCLFFCYRLDNDIRGMTFSLFPQLQLFTLVFLYLMFLSNSDDVNISVAIFHSLQNIHYSQRGVLSLFPRCRCCKTPEKQRK